MGEKMNSINDKRQKGKVNNGQNTIFIIVIIVMILGFIILTRNSMPNEISVFNNEAKMIDLQAKIFTLHDENQTMLVNATNDNSVSIENANEKDGKVTLRFLGIPIKSTDVNVLMTKELIPSGKNIGINIKTDGVMVLGTGVVTNENGENLKPWEDKLQPKDIIVKANGENVISKENLINVINENDKIDFIINRDGEIIEVTVYTVKSNVDGKNKIGVWVRDGTEGIGTLTYINTSSGNFGALGHGILDVDTGQLMQVLSGELLDSKVTTINKGSKGSPGELVGQISKKSDGEVILNTKHGIYGKWNSTDKLPEPMKVALKEEILIGEATILCEIDEEGVKEYKISIDEVNVKSADEKGMIIRITDETLLSKTNGIIQGMSGSPIIQNGKIVGAVTHVFVQDPTKGYGIFIENMLNEEKRIS